MSPSTRLSNPSADSPHSRALASEPEACAISLWYLGAANTTLAELIIIFERNT